VTAPRTRRRSRPARATGSLDVARLRRDFPILRSRIQNRQLVYLDNAATSQRPRPVLEAEAEFVLHRNANVHRGVHSLSQQATSAYDEAREAVRDFLHAAEADEIVFTSGTTAALNLVAHAAGRRRLGAGDEILLTEMEHHSNIVPWQLAVEGTGARIRVAPVTDSGDLDVAALEALLGPRTRIVALTHVSNVLGTVNPVQRIAALAHAVGALVVVDGAQAVPHLAVDVRELGCDFYAGSAHKMYGPTGIGFLYGRRELLEAMPPWQGGGGMIERVSFEGTSFAGIPARFEAGTPPISQAVGLAAAIRYLGSLDWPAVGAHERSLLEYARDRLARVPRVRLLPGGSQSIAVLSLVMEGVHPHDIGTVLDLNGVAVRASHHCAQPLMRRFGVSGTVRASFGLYNTLDEVDALASAVAEAGKVFH
jgi:cysteine desulfurase / selenocysteine lyase